MDALVEGGCYGWLLWVVAMMGGCIDRGWLKLRVPLPYRGVARVWGREQHRRPGVDQPEDPNWSQHRIASNIGLQVPIRTR